MVLLPPRKWGDLYYSAEFLEFCYYSYSNRVADSVNVYGLKYTIDNYSDSMRVLTGEILGLRAGSEWHIETKKIDEIQSSVIELYSLLHQRYVLSEDGLETMVCNARIFAFSRNARLLAMCLVSVLAICVITALFFQYEFWSLMII